MKINIISALISILLFFNCSSLMARESYYATLLVKSHTGHFPMPVLSTQIPDLNVETAYDIQKAYIEKRLLSDKLAGFKAGLTSEAGQKKFEVKAPVAGLLLASGKLTGNPIVDSSTFNLLMLETEIGFVFKETISEPLISVAQLQSKLQSILPVIEMPDLGYSDMQSLKGVDIIATNVAAEKFLVGTAHDFTGQDINSVKVILSRNGKEVNIGNGSDTLGDQWQASLWLINTMIEQGWSLEAGQIIITGALGSMIPGKPGKYTAEYGEFGTIEFEIR